MKKICNCCGKYKNIANIKTILQYDLDGNFIKEWDDIKNIIKEFKCHISSVYYALERKHKSSCGFIWRYKE